MLIQILFMIRRRIDFFAISCFLGSLFFLNSCATNRIAILYDGHVYINTIVNDSVRGNFMYDTGVSNFCLDTAFVKKNNLQFQKVQTIEIGGVGNETQMVNLVNDKVYYRVDKKYNYSRESYLIGLKGFMGEKIDGILGVKTFKNRPHKIDFIHKKLVFTDKYQNYDSIKFTFEDHNIYIPIDYTIDSKDYSGKFLLDLGSTTTVLNSTSGMDSGIGRNFLSIGGLGGETAGRTVFVDRIKLGNQHIDHYSLDVSMDKGGALADTKFHGLLGTDILDDFDIIIDFQKKNLYLKPNKKYNKHSKVLYKSFSFLDYSGIDNSWLVSYIYLDTDAYQKGLRLYDRILEIDGVKVNKLNRVQFFKSLKLNQELKLIVNRNGELLQMNVILEKFLGGNL